MIVCVLLPRFELVIAAGGREALIGGPAALAPEPGREQLIGEVSAAAETFGVHPGMRLGEALARCPRLALVPPDPAGVAEGWERVLVHLEGIGAGVAPERPGRVCFDADGLFGLHGGLEGVLDATRHALRPTGAASGAGVRIGTGPTPFCAVAAATQARARRTETIRGAGEATPAEAARAYLAPLPVGLLRARQETMALPEALERLGIGTLGELAALPRAKVADRFGPAGLKALHLAAGRDEPLRPRAAGERLSETLELIESASGQQLEHALELLIDRLLARRERRGRTLRSVAASAVLVEGGTWRERVTFREALADPERMRLALSPKLGLLPAPADSLCLTVERFGPPASDQGALLEEAASVRDARLREAVRQTRAAAGPDAAMRVLPIDPDSRVPERRIVLAPYEPGERDTGGRDTPRRRDCRG